MRILQMIWINLVGTYGVASAQLYWGRMAGLILRILYNLAPGLYTPEVAAHLCG